jgi:hypothetical protein
MGRVPGKVAVRSQTDISEKQAGRPLVGQDGRERSPRAPRDVRDMAGGQRKSQRVGDEEIA